MLAWQIDLGATEAIGDAPVDRYATELPERAPLAASGPVIVTPDTAPGAAVAAVPGSDAVAAAQAVADQATTLAQLQFALEAFDLCELKRGARKTVFADGNPTARIMIIGEAPDRDEDAEGRPFVGDAGQLLNRMFAAIGKSRGAADPDAAIYITSVMPWRTPQNREPSPDEIAMMQPFLARHVALVDPAIIVLMGNAPCAAALGARGITRLRGTWATAFGRPAMPMFHPAYLLRNPAAKREAWADLLALQERLRAGT